jgi:hypothetical protein
MFSSKARQNYEIQMEPQTLINNPENRNYSLEILIIKTKAERIDASRSNI